MHVFRKMLKVNTINRIFTRLKHKKTHWSFKDKKKFPADRALENLDDFYGSVYGNRWKSMRIGLLCEHKYIALVNNFGDTEDTIKFLEEDGAINVRSIYNIAKENLTANDLQLFSDDKVFKLDSTIEQYKAKQEYKEVSSVYPQSDNISQPESLKSDVDIKSSATENIVDFKKPLEKTIEEDAEYDYRRLVDSSFGESALHEFIPATKLKGMEDWVLESDHYKYYSSTADFPINIRLETELNIPESLNLYTYEKGNVNDFKHPKKCLTGVLSHFLMDGASIIPPLALNINPGDRVLDACAAPGGKSLLMLQSLYPSVLVCNDIQESRVNRIKKIMNEYFYDFNKNWQSKKCFIMQNDARNLLEYEMYDKILVDVPCTTDRHSLNENDNNIFKPSRMKERLRLPELQSAILVNALRLLKPGGSLVYSTCSLSPVQNDGVVHMALSNVFKEHGITTTIKDLSLVMKPFMDIFKFENPKSLKYGQMVVPFLPANFGPMYFCKITRNV